VPCLFNFAIASRERTFFSVGGILLVLGLFTRPAAFTCSGLLAFAYFLGHGFGPTSKIAIYPILNGGNLAVLYCFVFLYIAAAGAGAGPWSLDAKQGRG